MILTTGRQLEHWHTGAMTRKASNLDAIEPEATVSISWHTGSVLCTNRLIISQATDKEETISPPIKVSKGKTMIKLWDKCKIYNFRLAVLLPGRSEVSLMFFHSLLFML